MDNISSLEKSIARSLLDIGAIGFSINKPITFVSGICSPVYVDNRILPSHPDDWRKVIEGFVKVIKDKNIQFDIIAGIESGGIPHSAALGFLLGKPSVFVRKKVKDHGVGKRIAGGKVEGKKVLLIEDLVTTGGSSIAGVEALREEGAKVTDCLIIVGYGFKKARNTFLNAHVRLHSLTTFLVVLNEAVAKQIINNQEELVIKKFLNNPHNWLWA